MNDVHPGTFDLNLLVALDARSPPAELILSKSILADGGIRLS
jgi:hypothetical protein